MTPPDQLDPEIADVVRAMPIPDLDDNLLRDMREMAFPGPELSDLVRREEMQVPR